MTPAAAQAGHPVGHLGPHPGGEQLAVEQGRRHRRVLNAWSHRRSVRRHPGGGRTSPGRRPGRAQWRKWRSPPAMTIAIPASSAAAITSSSRIDPPGWTTAATPASASTSSPSGKGKKASEAAAPPAGPVPGLGHGDLGRHHPRLLAGTDAHGLAAGDHGDGVGGRPGADLPGDRRSRHWASVGWRRVATSHVGRVDQEPVGVLDQDGGAEEPVLAHQRLGRRCRQQPGGLALGRELGQGLLVVGGGDDHVGLRAVRRWPRPPPA